MPSLAMAVADPAAAAILWFEGFELPPEHPDAAYQPSLNYTDFAGDYFTHTTGADGRVNKQYSGWQGGSFWAGQDLDADADQGGNGENPQTIEFDAVDILGRSAMVFSGRFAAVQDRTLAGDGAVDIDDYLLIEYRVGVGAWQPLMRFTTDAPELGFFAHDPNIEGLAEGRRLTAEFQTFSIGVPQPHPAQGSTLTFRFTAAADKGNEDFAIDAFMLTDSSPPVPEPATAIGLGAMGLAAGLRSRRR